MEADPWFASVSINHADGSWWAWEYDWDSDADSYDAAVVHFAGDGAELLRVEGFHSDSFQHEHGTVVANPVDGSCWVRHSCVEGGGGEFEALHLAEDGTELLRLGGFSDLGGPSVNPVDGSCWMGQSYWEGDTHHGEVVHLAVDDTELLRVGGFDTPGAVSAAPTDGSCWVVDSQWRDFDVVHLPQDGAELARVEGFFPPADPPSLWVDPVDASC